MMELAGFLNFQTPEKKLNTVINKVDLPTENQHFDKNSTKWSRVGYSATLG